MHAALISNGSVFTWGSNSSGQLGHKNAFGEVFKLKSTEVSCGHNYTILMTENCELMITGQLPGNNKILKTFEQLAKFDKNV